MNKLIYIGGALSAALILGVAWHAKAADLGGNCCGDLEERVAELEATTARKGNRKVSLSISGYVSHSIMAWDDGGQKDIYIGDGGASSSRFRIKGDAKISADLTAGFLYEFGINNNALGTMNQGAGGDDLGGAVALRDSTVWLRHKSLGMVKIGHGSTATDNLILVDLSGASAAMTPDAALYNGGFGTRLSSLTINGTPIPAVSGLLTPITWGQVINGGISFDTARRNHVLYETPTLAGFTVAAAVAENSFWDVGLKYAGEFSGIRVAFGVGRSVDKEVPAFGLFGLTAREISEWKGSASVLHTQTGLFLNAAGGQREINWAVNLGGGHTLSAKDPRFWHVTAGWSKNVFGMGSTILFAEYMRADDFVGYSLGGPSINGSVTSDTRMWGIGVVQSIDAAALDVFLTHKRYETDLNLSGTGGGGSLTIDAQMYDFSATVAGVRIQF